MRSGKLFRGETSRVLGMRMCDFAWGRRQKNNGSKDRQHQRYRTNQQHRLMSKQSNLIARVEIRDQEYDQYYQAHRRRQSGEEADMALRTSRVWNGLDVDCLTFSFRFFFRRHFNVGLDEWSSLRIGHE